MRTWLIVIVTTLGSLGCSTKPVIEGETIDPYFTADQVLGKDITYAGDLISDPWEGFNRSMYRFNYQFDKYVFLPAVNVYQTITPDIAEQGVYNFFNNLRDVRTLINTALQLNGTKTLETAARIVWNSTAGLLGFIDVASGMDITRHDEDFGQTLGYWGVGTGPYLVLPIFGPSSLRDGFGLGVDWIVNREIWFSITNLTTAQDLAIIALWGIDLRANTGFRYYRTGSPFEYDDVRLLYTTKRKMDIAK
jgi:phospholipid-binding lipoprotein MlaA